MTHQRIPDDVLTAAHARARAREARDWQEADRLRAEIEAAGWNVADRGTAQVGAVVLRGTGHGKAL